MPILHEEIFNDLYGKIKDGYYKIGDKLPSEKELTEVYRSSKAPVRQAMSKLEGLGMIVRQAGKGTFVNQQFMIWNKLSGFSSYFLKDLPKMYFRNLTLEERATDEDMSRRLDIPVGTDICELTRVRYFDNIPTSYLKHYTYMLSMKEMEKISNYNTTRHILYQYHGIEISRAHEVIEAVVADEHLAELLDITVGFPLMRIERTSYEKNGRVAEFVEYFGRTDKWKYQVDLRE